MNPFISVVIPLYNGIEFLNEALSSVLEQTFTDWELLIGVNGHGPDGGDVFKQAVSLVDSKGSSKIRVINYPSAKGGAETLNLLAADSKSDWIAFLDVDDKWHPMKLLAQVHKILNLKPEADIIGTNCSYFGRMSGSPAVFTNGYVDISVFKNYNPMINSAVVMRKSLVDFKGILYDYDLWCRLILQNKIFYNIPSFLTYHRVHDGSYYNTTGIQDPEAIKRTYFPSEQGP